MKNYIILSIFSLILLNSFEILAQDKIIKRNGEVIECEVKEISAELVKYTIPDYGSVILDIEKRLVEKIVFVSGKEMVIDHAARVSESTELNSRDLFLVQRKMALKTDFLSPLWGVTTFTFEKAIKPSRSWELSLGIVGLGFQNPNDALGLTFKGSYKFMRSPDHYLNGMRYAHILKGSYIRPEIAFAQYSGTYESTSEDYSRTKFAFLINIGKQIVYDDFLVLDYFSGIGYGYSNAPQLDEADYYPSFPYGFAVGDSEVPIAFSWGLRIGILLGKRYEAE